MSWKIYRTLSVLALLLAISGLTPGQANATPWEWNEEQMETQVRNLYTKYERYATPTVHLSLSGFSTVYAEDFASHRLLDLVTLPGGSTLEGTLVQHINGNLLPETAEMRVSWTQEEDLITTMLGGELVPFMSLEEALVLAAEEDKTFSNAAALTSFDVTVTLEEQVRVYRSSCLWLWPNPFGQIGPAMIVLDGIVDGVDRVGGETRPPGGPVSDSPTSSCSCDVVTTIEPFPRYKYNVIEHTSGKHFLDVIVNRNCKCESNCNAILTWQTIKNKCKDRGRNGWLRSHKVAGSEKDLGGAAVCGSAATGKVAFACTVTSCPLGIFCRGVSAQIAIPLSSGGLPGAATFGYTPGTTIYKFEWEQPGVCGPCGGGPATAG